MYMVVALDWKTGAKESSWSPCLPLAPWFLAVGASNTPHFTWLLAQSSTRIPGDTERSKHPSGGQLHFKWALCQRTGTGTESGRTNGERAEM